MNPTLFVTIPEKPALHCPVLIGANLLDLSLLFPLWSFHKIVIITDNRVKPWYGLPLSKQLSQAGHEPVLLSFPPGERFKNSLTKEKLEQAMLSHRCDRDSLIVALGGGVVGDLSGFVAATFLRGIPYLQIPTTLLAMIDSSIGGKTGLNTKQGKNLIGAIHQPQCVIADLTVLKTLSKTALINGLIEAIKIFLTHDAQSFHESESQLQRLLDGENNAVKHLVTSAVKIKAAVVARDEKEEGERSLLNFGHTIGHALEKIAHYKILHGYAVAYGILVEATLSHLLGLLDLAALSRIKQLMLALGIDGKHLKRFDLSQILEATQHDKKRHFHQVHYVLLERIGSAYSVDKKYTHPVSDEMVRQAVEHTTRAVNHVR